MFQYQTEPSGPNFGQPTPLANFITHADAWGVNVLGAVYDAESQSYKVTVDQELTSDQIEHLNLTEPTGSV